MEHSTHARCCLVMKSKRDRVVARSMRRVVKMSHCQYQLATLSESRPLASSRSADMRRRFLPVRDQRSHSLALLERAGGGAGTTWKWEWLTRYILDVRAIVCQAPCLDGRHGRRTPSERTGCSPTRTPDTDRPCTTGGWADGRCLRRCSSCSCVGRRRDSWLRQQTGGRDGNY